MCLFLVMFECEFDSSAVKEFWVIIHTRQSDGWAGMNAITPGSTLKIS